MKKRNLILAISAIFILAFGQQVLAGPNKDDVWEWPGFNGSGYTGTPSGHYYYGWDHVDDDDSDDDDDDYFAQGWHYSPSGWWYQNSDGSWPENNWEFIDGRWYRFGLKGFLVTGWFVDQTGNFYYMNPVDDGTYGAMRVGWQMIDQKMHYFNPNPKTGEGRMLINTMTPDGYLVGGDGALIVQ